MIAIVGALFNALGQALRGVRRDWRRAWPCVLALPMISMGIAMPLGARRGLEATLATTGRDGAVLITSGVSTYFETSRIEARQADRVITALEPYAARTADGRALVGVQSIAHPEVRMLDEVEPAPERGDQAELVAPLNSTSARSGANADAETGSADQTAPPPSVGYELARTARLRGVPSLVRELYPTLDLIDGEFIVDSARTTRDLPPALSDDKPARPRPLMAGELAAARLGITGDRLGVGAQLELDGVLFEVVGTFRSRGMASWFDGELWCLHDDFRYLREPKPVGLMLYERPQASEFARMVNAVVWVPRDQDAEARAYHALGITQSHLPALAEPDPVPQTTPHAGAVDGGPKSGAGLFAISERRYYADRVRDLDPIAVATAVVAGCFGLTALLFVLAFAPWSMRADDIAALAIVQGATEATGRLIALARAFVIGTLASALAAGGAALLVAYSPPVTAAGGVSRLVVTVDEYAILVCAVMGVSLLGHAPIVIGLTRERIASAIA